MVGAAVGFLFCLSNWSKGLEAIEHVTLQVVESVELELAVSTGNVKLLRSQCHCQVPQEDRDVECEHPSRLPCVRGANGLEDLGPVVQAQVRPPPPRSALPQEQSL